MEKRVGFGIRFGAWVIDWALIVIVSAILGSTIAMWFAGSAVNTALHSGDNLNSLQMADAMAKGMLGFLDGLKIAIPLFTMLYFLSEALLGVTLGKLIVGIRIANADGTKANITTFLARFGIKNSGSIFGLIFLFSPVEAIQTLGFCCSLVIFIGCFFVLGQNKQAFQDMVAKTAVFKKQDIV
jgi:uncharacterized RDD family membrane protein YckC